MAETSVLREFLVDLGFRVDAASETKFREASEGADKRMKAFAGTLTVASAALSAYLTAATSKLNGLAISSNRVGASANNITSFQYAVQQMGGSAQAALQSLDGMAQKMRDMPGYKGVFTHFGIDPDKEKDNVESLLKLFNSDKFKAQSYSTQKAFADKLGIDDQTFRALQDPATLQAYREHNAYLEKMGVNLDESSKGARDLTNAVNELYSKLEGPAMKVAGDMAGDFAVALKAVNAQLDVLADWYSKLPEESKQTIETFAKIAGYVTAIAGAVGTIKMAGNILGGLGALATGGAAGGGAAAASGGGFMASIAGLASRLGVPAWLLTHSDSLNAGEDEWAKKNRAGWGKPSSASSQTTGGPRGIRNNNPGNIDYSGMYGQYFGATKEDGPGGRFARFATAQHGLQALAVQIKRYANAGYGTAMDIIGKWAPKGENNTKAYIESVSGAMGVSATTRLNLSDPKVMESLMNAVIKHENGRNPYSAALISDAAKFGVMHQGKFGGGWGNSPSISQTTNITVNGASDPRGTAGAVGDAQRNVNNDLARNFKVAAR